MNWTDGGFQITSGFLVSPPFKFLPIAKMQEVCWARAFSSTPTPTGIASYLWDSAVGEIWALFHKWCCDTVTCRPLPSHSQETRKKDCILFFQIVVLSRRFAHFQPLSYSCFAFILLIKMYHLLLLDIWWESLRYHGTVTKGFFNNGWNGGEIDFSK